MGFVISTIACIIVLTLINKSGDKREKHLTKKPLIQLFFRGFTAAVVVVIVSLVVDESFFTDLFEVSSTNVVYMLFDNFLLTALVEEGFKYIALKPYIKKHNCIGCSHHAVVAAIGVAAGFTAAENIVYIMADAGVLLRIVFGISGHYVYAVFMGYNISKEMRASDPSEKRKYHRRSFWIPVLMHGFYDFVVELLELDIYDLLFLFIFFAAIVVFVRFYIITAIKMIKETSHAVMWDADDGTENSATVVGMDAHQN